MMLQDSVIQKRKNYDMYVNGLKVGMNQLNRGLSKIKEMGQEGFSAGNEVGEDKA